MDSREEFEKWFKSVRTTQDFVDMYDYYFKINIYGEFCDSWVEGEFKVWQACQTLNDARIAELEEKLKASKEALGKIHNGVNSHFDAQMVAVEALKTIEG